MSEPDRVAASHGEPSRSVLAHPIQVDWAPWQLAACDAWEAGDSDGPHRGTLEIFTGGGKSLIALECLRRAATQEPDLRAMIVVPTLALARQWREVILLRTGLGTTDIGRLDGDRKDDLARCTVLIAVLNSAAEYLPASAADVTGPLMLIVDECHRAGAPSFSRALSTRAQFRLGLSATAEREDVDDEGAPIDYDEHVLGQSLGRIVYKFDLRAARQAGWLPEFSVHHHGVALTPDERRKYDELTRRVDDLADRLRDLGVDRGSARAASNRQGDVGAAARAYVGAVSLRKDLLYRAGERTRVVQAVVQDVLEREPASRMLLFHERIDEAVALHDSLAGMLPGAVGLEHSRMAESNRSRALEGFASGATPVLVSVKALVEGIDVPDADVGISVAASASVRQRVQALGRVLRRRFDGERKVAQMHVLYVAETVDDAIYGKEDWSDLTGEAANRYWLWPADSSQPEPQDGPPRTPRPTEDQFWDALGDGELSLPIEWTPAWPTREWRLDTRGSITDLEGRIISNPQSAVTAVQLMRPGGGRFRVSPHSGALVVLEPGEDGMRAWLVGRLTEPFQVFTPDNPGYPTGAAAEGAAEGGSAALSDGEPPAFLQPGQPLPVQLDRTGGTYRLRQKAGGVIERKTRGGSEFAGTADGEGPAALVSNARAVLEAWRSTGESGLTFHVSGEGYAHYASGGQPRFLAHVHGGFAWPSDE